MTNITRISSASATTLQRRAIRLRLDGLSLDAVGESLAVPRVVAVGHLIEALKRIPEPIEVEACPIQALERLRLDALQVPLWPRAESGDIEAMKLVLEIIELRARLAGIYVQ